MTDDEMSPASSTLGVTGLGVGEGRVMGENGVTTCLLMRVTGQVISNGEGVVGRGEDETWDLLIPKEMITHLVESAVDGSQIVFPDLRSAADKHSSAATKLRDTWEHIRHDLSRADLTALGCVAALFALAGAITQIPAIPRIVYPYLSVAADLGFLDVIAAAWTLWPRRITKMPRLPGSWPHARRFDDNSRELIESYAQHSDAHIAAGQVLALTPVVYRKWMTLRVVLPLFCAVLAVLLVGLNIGLSAG